MEGETGEDVFGLCLHSKTDGSVWQNPRWHKLPELVNPDDIDDNRRRPCETSIACRKRKFLPWRFRWRKRMNASTPIMARACGRTFPARRRCLKRCARRRSGIAAG